MGSAAHVPMVLDFSVGNMVHGPNSATRMSIYFSSSMYVIYVRPMVYCIDVSFRLLLTLFFGAPPTGNTCLI